jgi:hypothetical protein
MKYIALIILCSGCAVMKTESTRIDPDNPKLVLHEKSTVYSLGSKSMVRGFSSAKKTKTTSSLMSIEDAGTQTEIEKFAPLLESIVAGAVKGAK